MTIRGWVRGCILSCMVFNMFGCKTTQPVAKSINTSQESKGNAGVNPVEKDFASYILADSLFINSHVGFSLFDVASKKDIFNYQSNKYFVPASNLKFFTCYSALKYLGDSLVGLRYKKTADTLYIEGTGDPTFLSSDFNTNPVYDFLSSSTAKNIQWVNPTFTDNFLGKGWNWDDYKENFLVQRSNLPIYGNVIRVKQTNKNIRVIPKSLGYGIAFKTNHDKGLEVVKDWDNNHIVIHEGNQQSVEIPFKPIIADIVKMLQDTLHKYKSLSFDIKNGTPTLPTIIHSQPTKEVLSIMMHRSDNFFAEQLLLMVADALLDTMSDQKIIDTLLKNDFKNIPQKPKWVDGSGLSRYNLFTPQDFVWLLNKMSEEFAWQKITEIIPTGDEGTLHGYYTNYSGKIYAKTGSMSNNFCISGYLITNQKKQFTFSFMVNNFQGKATNIRKSIEKFLSNIIEKY